MMARIMAPKKNYQQQGKNWKQNSHIRKWNDLSVAIKQSVALRTKTIKFASL